MKYNLKKLFTLLLVAVMVILMMPMSALADSATSGDFTYTDNSDGTCTVTGYTGSDTDVAIPDMMENLTVTRIGNNAFQGCGLIDVNIPYTVTNIGANAFDDNSLTAVQMPMSLTRIEASAFANNNMSSVTFPSCVEFIGANAFATNTLTEIMLPKPDNNYIGKWTNSTGDEFVGEDLVPVAGEYTRNEYLPIFDYYVMEEELGIVSICDYNGLETDVVIPEKLNGYIVYRIDYKAFYDNGLTSVSLPSSVVEMGGEAFAGNASLTSINLPSGYKGYENSWTDFSGNEFASGAAITDLTKRYFAKLAFLEYEGDALIMHHYPDAVCAVPSTICGMTVKYIYNGAYDTRGITQLTMPDSILAIGAYAFVGNSITSVTLPEGIISIGPGAFLDNEGLESFSLPESPEGYISYWKEFEFSGGVCSVASEETQMRMPAPTITEVTGGYTVTNFRYAYTWDRNELKEYTITFKDSDGTVIKTVKLNYGADIEYPADPTKEGHEFNGWDSDLKTMPAKDVTITATYISKEVPRGNITGTLVDSDGNPIVGKVVKLHSKVITTVTDSKGRFTFADVALVDHTLIIESTEGNELGRYELSFGKSDSTSYSVDETDVDVNVTSSTVAIDILVNVSDDGKVSIEEITFAENPQTGDESSSLWWAALALAVILCAGAAVRKKATN